MKEIPGFLTLQYPDLWDGSLKILASTRNRQAPLTFRESVLIEARLKLLHLMGDEVLLIEYEKDCERLEAVLDLLIPVEDDDEVE